MSGIEVLRDTLRQEVRAVALDKVARLRAEGFGGPLPIEATIVRLAADMADSALPVANARIAVHETKFPPGANRSVVPICPTTWNGHGGRACRWHSSRRSILQACRPASIGRHPGMVGSMSFSAASIGSGISRTILDGSFTEEELSEDGNAFTESYFGQYLKDYQATLCKGLPSLYHAANSWESFDKLKPVLDARLAAWQAEQ